MFSEPQLTHQRVPRVAIGTNYGARSQRVKDMVSEVPRSLSFVQRRNDRRPFAA
jgi:hypothetical protein